MAGSIEEAMTDSLVDAGMVETDDFGELVGTEAEEDSPAETSGEEHPSESAEAAPAEGAAEERKPGEEGEDELDDLDKELEGAGIQKGQNVRLRYGKVRKIWEGWNKKLKEELANSHKKELEERDKFIATARERIGYMDSLNQLIRTNPRAYLELLHTTFPQANFRQLYAAMSGAQAQAQAQPAAGAADGEWKMPPPDATFADGTVGYSREGIAKILQSFGEHLTPRIRQQLKQEFDQQYGRPIQAMTARERDQAVRQANWQRVQSDVSWAAERFGELFTKDFGQLGNINPGSEIMKRIADSRDPNTGRATMTFKDAVVEVMLPKLQANRDAMRAESHEELRSAPRAARRSSPAAVVASTPKPPDTVEAAIVDSMRQAGMI